MKKIQSLSLLIFFILASFVSVYAKDEIYDLNYVLQLKGGFPYTIEDYAKEQGMTLEHFLYLENHSSYSIVEDDLKKIYEIRLKQIKPDSNTLMQKLVTKEVMEKYLNGEIKSPKGFISVCADLVHCRTIADFYYVLRMDYPHTKYNPDDEAIGIIRFKASNLDKCFIPFNKNLGGNYESPYPFPFTGHGFTAGGNGRWGSPEWVILEPVQLLKGSAIFELRKDGTEILKGVYDEKLKRFKRVNNNNLIKEVKGEK